MFSAEFVVFECQGTKHKGLENLVTESQWSVRSEWQEVYLSAPQRFVSTGNAFRENLLLLMGQAPKLKIAHGTKKKCT